jgi:hypothetical protein
MDVYYRGVHVILRRFVDNKSDVWAYINCSMYDGSNKLMIKVGICCRFLPL